MAESYTHKPDGANEVSPLKTASASVRRSQARVIESGGRRMPSGMLKDDAAKALDALLRAGYAPSAVAAISAALIAEARKVGHITHVRGGS